MSSNETVFVQILDKEYQVACPPGERDALIQAAHNLDERMRDIRGSGTVIGLERIAVMAALNLSHELLESKDSARELGPSSDRLEHLTAKVEQALEKL
ncbi:MAG: cell division protein ZapA [Cellvibrionaceae bacterium]|nr:cell division protein ZapA [Cellvibrionaceae bacterium]|tara:strand:+ start:148 stop:441 length:294 start_codon:yes stop_codon:yes gene_type:complete